VPTNAVPKLTPKQKQFAALVAAGIPPSQAAVQIGIAPRTGRKWATLPAVVAEIDAISGEITRSVKLKLRTLAEKALGALEKVLSDENAPAGARVNAAKSVLDLLFRLEEAKELQEIEERLTAMEAMLRGGAQWPTVH